MSARTYRDFQPTFEDRSSWTVPWLLRHRAETHGDRVYLDVPHQDLKMTFAETLAAAESLAGGLLAAGHAPGDRLLIMAPNSSEVLLAWLGSALAGMVEVPINTAYSGSFLEHQVRTTAPGAAVVDASLVERFEPGVPAYDSIRRFYVIGAAAEVEEAVAWLREGGRTAVPFATLAGPLTEPPVVNARDHASIFFTSGTTGLSKGVTMSNSQMVFFADEGRALVRLTDADVYMSVGPLFHGNAQFLAALPALIVGARFVLRERYSASRWIDQIRDCGATVTNFVGVMMDWTWRQPPRPDDADNDLRCIWAVPTASSFADEFKQRYGIEALVENFGLTETSMPILAPYGVERPAGAAGLLVEDYFDVRLVDPETDEEVPTGEVGELLVRAKLPWTMCSGYYEMPERTAEAQRNLWFHTGDGLRRDKDGWFYFVDRLNDALRRRGENISSFEVETAIAEHEAIAECAAVAIPAAAEGGEDEMAIFAVLEPGGELDEAELRAWCEQRLPRFAHPERVVIVTALPTTPSGKVIKAELRKLVVA